MEKKHFMGLLIIGLLVFGTLFFFNDTYSDELADEEDLYEKIYALEETVLELNNRNHEIEQQLSRALAALYITENALSFSLNIEEIMKDYEENYLSNVDYFSHVNFENDDEYVVHLLYADENNYELELKLLYAIYDAVIATVAIQHETNDTFLLEDINGIVFETNNIQEIIDFLEKLEVDSIS
ncbi:hypothetical protein [Evansella cellulosilytica]|uniref:Uncharacterized protein n=1 Tax=Evansella cellulosilytica (strain ATCC 21833 / DSM 2522 / FERM P-1141 / JCM 9156 / N-4) TaxID=649639 RepID=E6U0S0_EVAC2|nr:hypothetical protein [Evansella cellulosilytica]ADU29118.1 hypothetical protein Bcell_0840 [Evansella cellulosilytica DSM 2522]